MSSRERRAALAAQFEAEQRQREIEEQRRAARSMFEEIEEVANFSDVKEILHKLAEKLGLE